MIKHYTIVMFLINPLGMRRVCLVVKLGLSYTYLPGWLLPLGKLKNCSIDIFCHAHQTDFSRCRTTPGGGSYTSIRGIIYLSTLTESNLGEANPLQFIIIILSDSCNVGKGCTQPSIATPIDYLTILGSASATKCRSDI